MSSHRKQTLTTFLIAAAAMASSLMGTAQSAQAAGRTIYVSPSGNDSRSRLTAADQPVATITRAIRLAQPGDNIIVRAGTYTGAAGYGAVPGRSGDPIRLQAAPGARVVLKGTLQLENADYWRISGINVTQDPTGPRKEFLVKFDGGTGWEFVNSEVWGSKGVSNVMISGSAKNGAPRNYRIADDCIHDNNATGDAFMNDHNIYLMPGYSSGPGVIEHNILFNSENGAAIKAAGPSASTGASNVIIRRNTIARAAAGVIVGYGSSGVQIRDNLIGQQVKWAPAGAHYVGNYNAAVIGNHVSGTGDEAVSTAVWSYPHSLTSTADSRHPVKGAMTAWVNPSFDSTTSCSGFHPSGGAAKRFGRYS
jgi:hypothetical protein